MGVDPHIIIIAGFIGTGINERGLCQHFFRSCLCTIRRRLSVRFCVCRVHYGNFGACCAIFRCISVSFRKTFSVNRINCTVFRLRRPRLCIMLCVLCVLCVRICVVCRSTGGPCMFFGLRHIAGLFVFSGRFRFFSGFLRFCAFSLRRHNARFHILQLIDRIHAGVVCRRHQISHHAVKHRFVFSRCAV